MSPKTMQKFGPLDKTALLIVDLQNDFLRHGALAVPEADSILPGINTLAQKGFGLIIASRDHHPAHHCSFKEQGGLWPPHCIVGTKGAALSDHFHQDALDLIVEKGTHPERECYSSFQDDAEQTTGLAEYLHQHGIENVVVAGIALDHCVKASACDSVAAGFTTFLLPTLCPSIGEATPILEMLQRKGITLLSEEAFS